MSVTTKYYCINVNFNNNNRKYLEKQYPNDNYQMLNWLVLRSNSNESSEDIVTFCHRHNLSLVVLDNFVKPSINSMNYSIGMSYMIQDKNLIRFVKFVNRELKKFWEKDQYVKLSYKSNENFNGLITEMSFKVTTRETIDESKNYLDTYFKKQFYSKLKMYNEGRNIGIKKLKENERGNTKM